MTVSLTYNNNLNERLKMLVGRKMDVLSESDSRFIVWVDGDVMNLGKELFTAQGTYKGLKCTVHVFTNDNKCLIGVGGKSIIVDRAEVQF